MFPKRILHVTSVLNIGGIENFLMSVFRNIDRNKIIFDFLVIREDNGYYEEEIKRLGGKIYKIPSIKKKGYVHFKKNIDTFFKKHTEYDIVHSHVNALSSIVLKAAMKNGVKTRIAHSHTAFPKYSLPEKIFKNHLKKAIPFVATHMLACSTGAAKWLFEKKFLNAIILKNGVDISHFEFSALKRDEARKKLQIEDKFVILNIGRFSKEKNHVFLLSIFMEILKRRSDAILICVGNGKLKKYIRKLSSQPLFKNKVLLFDAQEDITFFLNASDVYVSPSIFEGFGISALEAQLNFLPCVLSDSYPEEVNISKKCIFLSLKDHPKTWAENIVDLPRKNSLTKDFSLSQYDIRNTVKFLTDFYLNK